MKRIELRKAEVVKLYGSDETIKEFETEKGTVMSFQVKTKVNDQAEKCPVIFDNCTFFANSSEAVTKIRGLVIAGNIVDIKGYADRRKGKTKDGADKWYDQVSVKEITPIEVTSGGDDSLPF